MILYVLNIHQKFFFSKFILLTILLSKHVKNVIKYLKKKIPELYFGQFLFDFGILDTTMIGEARSLSSAPNILFLIIIKENQF